MAHKKVKKAAGKQAKTKARRPARSVRKPAARKVLKKKAASPLKKKVAAKPLKKKVAVKPLKKKAASRKAAPPRVVRHSAKGAKRGGSTKGAKPAVAVKAKAPSPTTRVKPKAVTTRRIATPPPARLQRERRRLPEADAFENVSEDSRLMNSARAGHDELRSELKKHTESSPTMTAGDVDAKWQDAYALGDEAPGGDNMTPDQDRVDDIGRALGIEYADDEELLGGDELTERDEHRWELDPASKEEDEDL